MAHHRQSIDSTGFEELKTLRNVNSNPEIDRKREETHRGRKRKRGRDRKKEINTEHKRSNNNWLRYPSKGERIVS